MASSHEPISERAAWEILDRYVQDCLEIDRESLRTVYATGSLSGGYYRPGQSDIDAVLIVADGSQEVWGDWEECSERLAALNQAYTERCRIPKELGGFALQESTLYPPYDPTADILPLEIARLKVQGVCVYGAFDLESVPMPTADDYRRGARNFEAWMDDAFLPEHPIAGFSEAACVNTILIYLGRYLRIERGVLEFDKRAVIAAYRQHDPPFVNQVAFRLVEASLAGETLSEPQIEELRRYAAQLRTEMNQYLGVRSDE
jgi:predicted nucleotidyltransferase